LELGWLLAAATDFTWADAVITREALRTKAAKMGLLIVVLTFPNDLLASVWLGHSASAPLSGVLRYK
jgi:hypothetical protein